MIKQWAKQRGFTIVELLVVIVVIGILATITIVGYNGAQTQARNAQVVTGVDQYVDAIQSYEVKAGSYPAYSGCLGANYPDDNCWLLNGSPNRSVNPDLDAALSAYVPDKPTLATKLLDLGLASNNYQRAGLLYTYYSSTNIQLRYYLDGHDHPCMSGFVFANEGKLTRCIMTLSN